MCLCCKTRGKVVSIERKAARVVGRARDCVRRSLAKAMLPLEEMNFGCHREFRVSGGEACVGLH